MNNRLINNEGAQAPLLYSQGIPKFLNKFGKKFDTNEKKSTEKVGAHRNNEVGNTTIGLTSNESIASPDKSVNAQNEINSTIRGLEDDFLTGVSPEELADIESEVDRRLALQDEQIITLQEQINELTGQRDDLFRARMILTAVIKYSLTFYGFSV